MSWIALLTVDRDTVEYDAARGAMGSALKNFRDLTPSVLAGLMEELALWFSSDTVRHERGAFTEEQLVAFVREAWIRR